MPVNTGLEPSPETLGSNYEGDDDVQMAGKPGNEAERSSAVGSQSTGCGRRRIVHAWPDLGTQIHGRYRGETYAALVIAAPKLKSGRAIQLTGGPASGQTLNSMSRAMEAATAEQRRQLGLGKSKKGLPASGWDFWSQVESKRMSA